MAAGSNTPSLIAKVLKWREDHPEDADRLWTSLDEGNREFGRLLDGLSKECEDNRALYEEVVGYLSSLHHIQVSGVSSTLKPVADLPRISFLFHSGQPIRTYQEDSNRLLIVLRSCALHLRFAALAPLQKVRLIDLRSLWVFVEHSSENAGNGKGFQDKD